MFSKPLAYASTHNREALWSPALANAPKIRRQKQPLIQQHHLPRRSARGPFSLRRGLKSVLDFLQAEHHLVDQGKQKGDPFWVALASSLLCS
jgi:hypothetical protein